MQPVCHEENTGPCAQLFYRNRRHLLLDVSYYNNRINLEIYHALADGTGVMQFLKYMVCCYLAETHPEAVGAGSPTTRRRSQARPERRTVFRKYYRKGKKGISGGPAGGAYRLTGTPAEKLFVTEGLMSCGAVLKLAKAHGTTLTVFSLRAAAHVDPRGDAALQRRKSRSSSRCRSTCGSIFPRIPCATFSGTSTSATASVRGEDSFEAILASLKTPLPRSSPRRTSAILSAALCS